MDRSERTNLRNENIRKEFKTLKNEKVNEQRKYRQDAIYEILANKYFLSPQTIYDIVYYTGSYRNKVV